MTTITVGEELLETRAATATHEGVDLGPVQRLFASTQRDVFGPREIKGAFGIEVDVEAPFTRGLLQRASGLGLDLLLLEPEGMSMRDIYEHCKNQTSFGDPLHPLLLGIEGYKDEQFYHEGLPGGWCFMSRDVLDGSLGKEFSHHQAIVAHHVYRLLGRELLDPVEFRPSPVELFWYIALYERAKKGLRIMGSTGSLTNATNSMGLPVCMGRFGPRGIAVGALPSLARCAEFPRLGDCFIYRGDRV